MAHRTPSPRRLPAPAAAAAALLLVATGLTALGLTGPAAAGPAAETAQEHHLVADGHEMPDMPDPPPGEWIPVDEPVEPLPPSEDVPFTEHREFQANCSVSHTAPDDPIVFPEVPGGSHDHTFMGNTTTDAFTTLESLYGGETTCLVPGDLSAYWMPTLFDGDGPVLPVGDQVIYYKSGIYDFATVQPFPTGLRYVVGSPMQSAEEFYEGPGSVQGWECGDDYDNENFPSECVDGSQLNVRYQAPSCWDGIHLDSPNHQDHMAYPVIVDSQNACPDSHPVAVPMIEFKMAWPVEGDMSDIHLASGEGYSFHYDFFNAWDEPVLGALVGHCINGGLQCDPRGFDQYNPEHGAALNEDYELP